MQMQPGLVHVAVPSSTGKAADVAQLMGQAAALLLLLARNDADLVAKLAALLGQRVHMQIRAGGTAAQFGEPQHELLHLAGGHVLVLEEDDAALGDGHGEVSDQALVPPQEIPDLEPGELPPNDGRHVGLLDVIQAARVSQRLRDARAAVRVASDDVVVGDSSLLLGGCDRRHLEWWNQLESIHKRVW